MATSEGDRDMFETSDSSLDTTLGEEEEEGVYKIVSGKRMNVSKLWLAGDYLYTSERPNKRILTPTGTQAALHLKCRNYSAGCRARAQVNENDKFLLKEGYTHTCSGGGKEAAAALEVGVEMRKTQLDNPREDSRKIFNQFHGSAAQQLSFDSTRRQMARIKNSRVPPAPKTAQEAGYIISQSLYADYMHAEVSFEEEIGLIWYHPQLNTILEELALEQEVSCDATFKLVPHIFGGINKQHWTIFILVGSNFLPAVQVRNWNLIAKTTYLDAILVITYIHSSHLLDSFFN